MVIKTSTLKLASVGLVLTVAGIWWLQRSPSETKPQTTTTTAKSSRPAGVRPDTFDSARRTDNTVADEPNSPVANANEPAGPANSLLALQQSNRAATPTPPSEPIVPTAYAIAASEAAQAAQAEVLAQVQGIVGDARQNLRNSCWTGDVPAAAVFPMSATFGEDGNMLALSITDDRSAPQVGACIRNQPWALKVDPPGVKVTVELPIELP